MNSGRNLARLAAAVIAAGVAGACTRDRGAARVAGPAEPLAEHARVSGVRHDAFVIPTAPGAWGVALDAPFAAEVSDGVAADSGAFVAVARGLRVAHTTHPFTDKEGHPSEIRLDADDAGSPVRHVTLSRDGQPVIDVDYTWEPRGRGWVLRKRSTTVYAQGRPILRRERSIEQEQLASADIAGRVSRLAGATLTALAPQAAQAQLLACLGYDVIAALWGTAAVAAAAAFVAFPNAVTLAGVAAALGAFDRAMDAFILCMSGPMMM